MSRNSDDFVTFILKNPTNVSYAFNGYVDRKGEDRFISEGLDARTHLPRRKRFKFTRSKRRIWIAKERKKEIEFLRDHPACEGSPNGKYIKDENGRDLQVGVMFKEMKDAEDAQSLIKTKELQLRAANIAIGLKGEDLNDMAYLCGSTSNTDSIKQADVLVYAENNPDRFLEYWDSPDRKAKSLIKKAHRLGAFTTKGFLTYWGSEYLGKRDDDDGILSKLLENKDMMSALETEISKLEKSKK